MSAYDESKASDVIFMIDGSRSMGGKVKSAGMSKMALVKEGLLGLIGEHWPVSYFPWPLRMGVYYYRLLGTPGSTEIQVAVPINPAPASLELYLINEAPCRGGSPLLDALRFCMTTIAESIRPWKRVKLVSDGGNDRDPVKGAEDELKACGVPFDAIEVSNSASQELRDISAITGGHYSRPANLAKFAEAIRQDILPPTTA
jgi:Mg-chelatase subunit ChlD